MRCCSMRFAASRIGVSAFTVITLACHDLMCAHARPPGFKKKTIQDLASPD